MTETGPRDDAKLAAIKLEWWPRSDWNRWPPSLESAGIADYTLVARFDTLRGALRLMYPDGDFSFITKPGKVSIRQMLPMERGKRFVPDSRHAELWAETLFHEALTLPDPVQRQKQVRDAALIGMRACKILGGWRNWAIFWVHGKWTGLVAKL